MEEELEVNEQIADALFDISKSLRLLGWGNVLRDDHAPGAIEDTGRIIAESSQLVAEGLHDVADAIRELAGAVGDSK